MRRRVGTHEATVENTILDGQTVDGGVEIAVGDFKFGELDCILVVKQAKL